MSGVAEQSLWKLFLEEAQIPGFSKDRQGRSKVTRVLWISTGIIVSFLSLHGFIGVVLHYYSEPTASSVRIYVPKKFPPIVYCPRRWINQGKIKDSGVDVEDLYAYLSALNPFQENGFASFDFTANISVVETIMNGDIKETLNKIAYDIREVISAVSLKPPKETAFYDEDVRVVTNKGICYGITVKNMLSPLESTVVKLSIKIKPEKIKIPDEKMQPVWNAFAKNRLDPIMLANMSHEERNQQIRKHFEKQQEINKLHQQIIKEHYDTIDTITQQYERWYFGDAGFAPYQEGDVSLMPNTKSQVRVQVSKIKKKSTKKEPCKKYSEAERKICAVEVMNVNCIKQGKLPLFLPSSNRNFTETSSFAGNGIANHCILMNGFVNAIKEATDACAVPCKREIYDVTVIPGINTDGENEVLVGYVSPTSSLVVEEQYIYSTDTFISNLGGALSLWSGVSLITVANILFFFLDHALSKSELTTETASSDELK